MEIEEKGKITPGSLGKKKPNLFFKVPQKLDFTFSDQVQLDNIKANHFIFRPYMQEQKPSSIQESNYECIYL